MWGEDEDIKLRRAVSTHGPCWAHLASLGVLPGRTSASMRLRWGHLRDKVPSPPPVAPVVRGLEALGLRRGRRCAWPAFEGPFRGRAGRDCTGGRPWDYFVTRTWRPEDRAPTERQQDLLRCWGVDPPTEPLVMCNLHVAESAVRRWLASQMPSDAVSAALRSTVLDEGTRAELGVVYRPGEPCSTLTSSNSNLWWISCTDGRRGFASRTELAHFMGHNASRCLPALERVVASDYRANGWIAESVHGRTVVCGH